VGRLLEYIKTKYGFGLDFRFFDQAKENKKL
jgi:hypothetical protein